MMDELFFALWFFLPAGIANVMPIFAAKWKILEPIAKPLDLGLTFRGKRLIGNHKTFRGLIVGIATGILATFGQVFLFEQSTFIQGFSSIDYVMVNPLLLGFLLSFGALAGDAVKSIMKRRIGIAEGKTWFPFDQLDYIVGGILASMLYVQLSITQYLMIAIVWFLIHIASTMTGFLLKLKTSPI